MNNPSDTAQKLIKALRTFGVLSLVGSGIVFLLQGIFALDSFARFLSFTSVTAGLGLLGIFTAKRMQEPKSARAFLALAAAATPILYAQIGAMIYGTLNTVIHVPQAFVVTPPSIVASLLALAGTTLAMIPILWVGFGALIREQAKGLVGLLIASSAFLLLPWRDPTTVAILVFGLLALQAFYSREQAGKKSFAGEGDQKAARFITLIPIGILLGRQMFYLQSEFFFASLVATLAALCFLAPPNGKWHSLGWAAAVGALGLALDSLVVLLPWLAPARWLIVAYPLTVGAAIVHSVRDPQSAETSGRLWCLEFVAGLIPIQSVVMNWSTLNGALAIALGAAVISLSLSYRRKVLFVGGVSSVLIGLLYFTIDSWRLLSHAPWLSLAGVGIVVILLAGWLERNRETCVAWANRFNGHFQTETGLYRDP